MSDDGLPTRHWVSFAAMVAFGITNALFGYLNWQERVEMRAEQNMTRQMLDSRATIQLLLIDAAKTGRPLTPDEVRVIDRLYVPAEYDKVDRK